MCEESPKAHAKSSSAANEVVLFRIITTSPGLERRLGRTGRPRVGRDLEPNSLAYSMSRAARKRHELYPTIPNFTVLCELQERLRHRRMRGPSGSGSVLPRSRAHPRGACQASPSAV